MGKTRLTKTGAFAHFSITVHDLYKSWSGRSKDGQRIVLTFWEHLFDQTGRNYFDIGWSDDQKAKRHFGNEERKSNIQYAQENLGGLVSVIILTAGSDGKTIKKRRVEDYQMKICSFDPTTGEWSDTKA